MAEGRPRLPTRTCVGCRERSPKATLLRVVAVEGACVPDPKGRLPGRGAYVHPVPECLEAAERRRSLPRSLRTAAGLDLAPVRDWIGSAGSAGP